MFSGYEVRPAAPGPQYGMTAEQTAIRVAQLRANEKPYKRDTPQPGEVGYGQPIIVVQGGSTSLSGPIEVTPTYRCHFWSFANQSGEWFDSQYPCETPRRHYSTFPNGYGWQ